MAAAARAAGALPREKVDSPLCSPCPVQIHCCGQTLTMGIPAASSGRTASSSDSGASPSTRGSVPGGSCAKVCGRGKGRYLPRMGQPPDSFMDRSPASNSLTPPPTKQTNHHFRLSCSEPPERRTQKTLRSALPPSTAVLLPAPREEPIGWTF